MFQNLRRRTLVRIVSFTTAALLALLCTLVIQQRALMRARQVNANTYLRAFDQLTSSVDKLDSALEKCVYATTSPMLAALSSEVYAEALSAQQALGELPYANLQLEETAAFVAKTGDYAAALSKAVASSDGYTGSQLEEVQALHEAASTLKERLRALETSLYDGTTQLEDVDEVTARLQALTDSESDILAGSSYQDIEAEFPELPTLIYDGPFSHHLQSREAKALEGKNQCSREEARSIAAQWLDLPQERLSDCSDLNGELPCWVFGGETENGAFTIEVTKQGGEVLSWGADREMGAERIGREEAMELARSYLEERGLTGMEATYSIDQGNCLTVNFAYAQEKVLCYPDLVKVELAMDTGDVVGYEASGYLMNHTQREGLSPSVSREKARTVVSDQLTIQKEGLAVIPTDGEYEELCWEFQCENEDGIHYIVYVNAETGAEQKLLRLIEDESGTLVQ